jgi:tetratricopeptide (TPR) repeat protein
LTRIGASDFLAEGLSTFMVEMKEKAALEQQITNTVEACKEKLGDRGTVNEVRECLAPAMELNPEHPSISEMIGAAQSREELNKVLAKQRAARRAKMMKGEVAYERAKALYKKGHLAKSISAYERFLNTAYPDLEKTKANAQREVASIRGELNHKVSSFMDTCRALGDKNQYKEAYLACEQALKEDPGNEQAKTLQAQMLSNLRRDLKSIYEDSVLEESLGNVDSAKEKWKKIIKEDLDTDDYAHKARTLLKKYGVDM